MTTEREKVVGVRLSTAEHERLEKAAAKLGLKVSQYLRMVALRSTQTPE